MSAAALSRIPADALRRLTADLFIARGMREEDAQTVAQALVWADVRGIDTHGVSRLPQYFGFMDRGDLDPRAQPGVAVDLPASLLLDAQHAAGPVAMRVATGLVRDKAQAAGIALALVARTTHTGALGHYTQALAQQGLVGIAMAATGPFIVYPGSTAAAVGTNPLSIAVPGAASQPIVLDMTTGATSLGHLMQSRRDQQPLAPGLAADAQGRPTSDPQLAQWLLPMAGAKGAGLSLMIELLASHLSGHPLLAEALEGTPPSKRHRQNALLLAIDGSRFTHPDEQARHAERLVQGIHGLPRSDPGTPPRLPGERGDAVAAERTRHGVPLAPRVLSELTTLAQSLGLDVTRYLASPLS
jgi:ureidoglycolate dehydrogenase (NAD+)